MKLSVWLFLNDLFPAKRTLVDRLVKQNIYDTSDLQGTFKKLKAAGFNGVELLLPKRYSRQDVESAKQTLDSNGFAVNSIHQALRFLSKTPLSEVEMLCLTARDLSAKVVTLHISSAGDQILEHSYIETVHALEREYHINIGFENGQRFLLHPSDPHSWQPTRVEELLRLKDLHMTFDTTHLAQAGGDIKAFYLANQDRIVNIHLSDYRPHAFNASLRPTAYTHMPVGRGSLPIKDLLLALKDTGYKGLITLEINGGLDEICHSGREVAELLKR